MPARLGVQSSARGHSSAILRGARIAPNDRVSPAPIEVEVVLDEDELFEVPHQSGRRLRATPALVRTNTAAFAPSTAVLDALAREEDDAEVTRVSIEEVRKRLGGQR